MYRYNNYSRTSLYHHVNIMANKLIFELLYSRSCTRSLLSPPRLFPSPSEFAPSLHPPDTSLPPPPLPLPLPRPPPPPPPPPPPLSPPPHTAGRQWRLVGHTSRSGHNGLYSIQRARATQVLRVIFVPILRTMPACVPLAADTWRYITPGSMRLSRQTDCPALPLSVAPGERPEKSIASRRKVSVVESTTMMENRRRRRRRICARRRVLRFTRAVA